MASKKARLIINPVSGTRSKSGLDLAVKKHLEPLDISIETVFTMAAGHAFELASEALDKKCDLVIAAGGDGTINEVANALSFSNCPLGIIPYGSGNGLARSIGIPPDISKALKIIQKGHIIACDRGVVNNHPFYCTFGVGFDAAVSHRFAKMEKRGRISYIRSALREFFKYHNETYAITINDKTITEEALLIAVCNAPQYGNNAYIGPKAKLNDGLLDITIAHTDSSLHALKMSMDLLTGVIDKNRHIDILSVPSLVIHRDQCSPVHLDGEPLIMEENLFITCQKKALLVFAPEKNQKFVPYISPLRAILSDLKYDVMHKFIKNH